MYCSHCGEKNDDGSRFCKTCGTLLFRIAPPTIHQSQPYPSNGKKEDKASASKPAPAINPFGDTIVIEDDTFVSEETTESSHWGVRITMVLMLLVMLALVFVNARDKMDSVMEGVNMVHSVFASVFYLGSILFGLWVLLSALCNPLKKSKKIASILIASVAGIISVAAMGGEGTDFVPAVVSTVISVLLLIFNSSLQLKDYAEDEFDFGTTGEAEKNPLL